MPKKIVPKRNQSEEHHLPESKESKLPDEESKLPDEESKLPDEESKLPDEESLEIFAQKIRETRIANNLSLESVSGHLHISVKILKAIEEGKPEKGPTPVFFRGLVRTYCKFLELDKTDFIDKFDNLLRLQAEEEKININTLKPVLNVRDTFPIKNILTFLVIFFGGSLLYYLYVNQTKLDNTIDNITIVDQEILKNPKKFEVKKKIQQKTNFQEKENLDKPSVIKKITNLENQKKRIIEPTSSNENKEPLTLEVEASEGTWISLAIDNLATHDYRIDADEIKQWHAEKNFILTIGNTKVVRVLLNGREIETDRTNDLLLDWVVDSNLLP